MVSLLQSMVSSVTSCCDNASVLPVTKVYRRAIHSTVGNAQGPPGLVAEESIRAALNKVVEGLVLNLLLELQKEEQI